MSARVSGEWPVEILHNQLTAETTFRGETRADLRTALLYGCENKWKHMALSDPEHKAMVLALMRDYPRLDQLQAETLVWGYFNNSLNLDQQQNEAPAITTDLSELPSPRGRVGTGESVSSQSAVHQPTGRGSTPDAH